MAFIDKKIDKRLGWSDGLYGDLDLVKYLNEAPVWDEYSRVWVYPDKRKDPKIDRDLAKAVGVVFEDPDSVGPEKIDEILANHLGPSGMVTVDQFMSILGVAYGLELRDDRFIKIVNAFNLALAKGYFRVYLDYGTDSAYPRVYIRPI